jgi:hypothetical protein
MDTPITSKEINSVIKNLPIKQIAGPGEYTGKL